MASGVSAGRTSDWKVRTDGGAQAVLERPDLDHADAVSREGGEERMHDERVELVQQRRDAGADGGQLFGGRHAARVWPRVALGDGALEARDADHEELVQVRRDNRREPHALEERIRVAACFLEHTLVEGEPR